MLLNQMPEMVSRSLDDKKELGECFHDDFTNDYLILLSFSTTN